MNQKGFINIILIVIVVVFVAVAGYFLLIEKPKQIIQQSTTPSSSVSPIPPPTQTPTPTTTKNTKITDLVLKVDAPFSTATITIKENGSVLYQAQQRGQKEIRDSGAFTETQMNALAKLIEQIDFFKMKDRGMGTNDPLDGSTYTITAKFSQQGQPELVNTVSCYEFNCDHKFLELKNKIIEFWGRDILEMGV